MHVAGTVLAVGLLILLFSRQGWDEIFQAFRQIAFWRLILALVLTLTSRVAVAGRWHVLLVAAGVGIPFQQTLRITFAGLFASQFLPTTVGGDVVRLGGVLRLGYGRAVSLASLVVDRLIGMAGMAMAGIGLLFQLPEVLRHWRGLSALEFPRGKGFSRMVLIYPAVFGDYLRLHRYPWLARQAGRIRHWLGRFLSTLLGWQKRPDALFYSLICTWIHMLCLFVSISLFLPPLGERMSFWMIAGLWSLTYFVTLLPISVNGLGVQELSMTFFYTQLGGLQLANALTVALLIRVIQMFASLPGVLFIPGLLAGEQEK